MAFEVIELVKMRQYWKTILNNSMLCGIEERGMFADKLNMILSRKAIGVLRLYWRSQLVKFKRKKNQVNKNIEFELYRNNNSKFTTTFRREAASCYF